MKVREWAVGVAALLAVTGGLFAQATPVLKDDLIIGVNSTSTTDSIRWVRGGSPGTTAGSDVMPAPRPWVRGYLECVQFDNANNISHNAAGNLLAVDYGTTTVGFGIYQLATDGSGAMTQIGNSTMGGFSSVTRAGGVSASPDNTKIAIATYDTQQVVVYNYNAGSTIGTGAGASLSNGQATAVGTIGKSTTSTTWYDNNNVLALSNTGDLLDVNASTMASQVKSNVASYFYTAAVQMTGLIYNPLISPYIYGSAGHYVGGVDASEIFVWDKNFNLVKEINIDNEALSARALALDSKGDLIIGAFGNQVAWGIPASKAQNPSTMTDDSAVLYYTSDFYSSYSGLDVASSVGAAHTYLPADFNQDLKVSFADYLILEANFGKSGKTNATGDANNDGKVSFADYLILEAEFGHTTTPEPATIGLLVLGGLGLLRKRS